MFRPCTLRLSNIPPVSKEVLGMSGPRGRYPERVTIKLKTLLLILGGLLLSSDRCDDATSSRRGIALALAIPGVVLLASAGVMKLAEVEAEPAG